MKWYFAVLLCLLAVLLGSGASAQLRGDYTIDSNLIASPTNYKNFQSAVDDLVLGKRPDGGKVNGPGVDSIVNFNIADGQYYEKLAIKQVSGASVINTITFSSSSHDSSKVTLLDTSSINPTNNYTLYLDGADFITFRQMTILRGGSGSYCNVIQIDNEANGNTFTNDRIIGRPATKFSYPYSSLIYSAGSYPFSTDSGNVFRNNLIRFGYYAFSFNATSVKPENGNIIEGNTIDSQYYGGIFIQYQSNFTIRGNSITNLISTYATGIFSSFSYYHNLIWGNKLVMPNGGQGIEMEYNQPSSADTSLVANNFISIGGAAYAGLYAYTGDYIRFYNNNVLLYGSAPYPSFAASVVSTYSTGSHFVLKNNNFVNLQSGPNAYSVYFYNNAVAVSDYNNLFTKGSRLGNNNSTAYSSISAWQKGTLLDSHSVSLDPGFTSLNDLHISNVSLNGIARPEPQVSTDIDGQQRNSLLPDIGADEIFPVNNDAGITYIDSPQILCTGSWNIYVKLKNFGLNAFSSVVINWKIDTASGTRFNFSGSLPIGADTLVKIGSYAFSSVVKSPIIKAWTSLPNGVGDSLNNNDTAFSTLHHGLSGVYTIGGPGGSFASFSEAARQLNINGVCGNVIFNIRDGVYREQVRFKPIAGTSFSARVIFQSQSGDSSKVLLSFPASNLYSYNNNYTLSLQGASWVEFKNISIIRSGLGYYGHNINIANGAAHNIFINNIISTEVIPPASYSFYSDADAIHSEGNNNNTFQGNYIKGGSYNAYFKGSQADFETGTVLTGNLFDSSFWGGVYLMYQSSPVFEGNSINNVQSNYGYALALYYTYGPAMIKANRLQMYKGGAPLYLGYGCKGTAVGRILIANNFISLSGASGYNDGGIVADNCDSVDIIYNNILVTDPSKTSSAVYINSINNSIRLFNNNFVNTGGGYAINVVSGNLQASSNNNLFTGTHPIGYFSGSKAYSLADWQSISAIDSNSISVDPLYFSNTNLHVGNSALEGEAKPMAGIKTDIDGEKRNAGHPDIGADEFFPFRNDAGIVSIDSPAAGFCGGVRDVYIRLRNYGTDTLKSLSISWSVNGVSQAGRVFSGILKKGAEITYKLGSVNFITGKSARLLVYCSNPNGYRDSQPANDTILRITNTGLTGAYTIGGKLPDFKDFNSAATALSARGLCGAVMFNVRNGIYEEQVSIGKAPGISPKNTITFQSESGDSTTAVIDFPSSSGLNNNYTLQLNGAQFTTFKNLTLSRSGGKIASNVISILGESSDNVFMNNRLSGVSLPPSNLTSYYYSSALVYSAPSQDNRNLFLNNNMSGNFWGFYCLGTGIGATETGTTIRHNIIDSVCAGIFIQYQDSAVIENNIIEKLKGSYYGIQAYYTGGSPVISKNLISMPNGGYGLYSFYMQGSYGQPALISNNVISIHKYGSGIYSAYSDYAGFYYNTVITNTRDGFAAAGFQGTGANSCELYNNIFISKGTGPALSAGAKIITASDNNNLLSVSKILATWDTSSASSLAALQKVSGFDSKSLSIDPGFIDTTAFHISINSPVIHKGVPIPGTLTDIDGQIRNRSRPDIGADEANPYDNDLALTAILSPVSGDCGDSSDILMIKVKNNGLKTVHGFKIYAEISGNKKTFISGSFPAGGALSPGTDTVLAFPAPFNTYSGGNYSIIAYTSLLSDSNNANDTLVKVISLGSHLKPPIARNGNVCGSGYLTLKASSSDSIAWFDSSGVFINSGDSINTVFLTRTRQYFVQAIPRVRNAGLWGPDSGGGYNSSADMRKGLVFDALSDITLDSLTVYPEKSGRIVINIRDSKGKAFGKIEKQLSIPGSFSPVRLGINIKIPKGSNYSIDALNSDVGGLYANGVNSIGKAHFPYTWPGLISINDNTDNTGKAGYYYYFYDWKLSKGFACESNKKQVLAVVGKGTKPKAGFKTGISCNGTALITDTSLSTGTSLFSHSIDFGDSLVLSDTLFRPESHFYSKPGYYRALLTIVTSGGCSDTVSHGLNIAPALRAAFAAPDGCLGDSLHFVDITFSITKSARYTWLFGDSDSSSLQSPGHVFPSAGTYKVKLTVNSSLCTDSFSRDINIYSRPKPSFSFTGQCLGSPTNFINTSISTDSVKDYSWYIDSSLIKKRQFNYTFKKAGTYSIVLKANTVKNCVSADTARLTIHPVPVSRFTYADSSGNFMFEAKDSLLKSYNWDFGDSSTSYKGFKVTHAYQHAAKHIVNLNVLDSNGCSSSFDTTIAASALGINFEQSSGIKFALFPNPYQFSSRLFYTLDRSMAFGIEVQDITGKIIYSTVPRIEDGGDHSLNIDLAPASKGVYILKITHGETSSFIRMIKL